MCNIKRQIFHSFSLFLLVALTTLDLVLVPRGPHFSRYIVHAEFVDLEKHDGAVSYSIHAKRSESVY
jgi:hypothetical protein